MLCLKTIFSKWCYPSIIRERAKVQMSIIKKILTEFYYCTGISIQFVDQELNLVESMGDIWEESIEAVVNEIHKISRLTELSNKLNLHHIIYPLNQRTYPKGYFIAGPYQSKQDEFDAGVFKPASCNIYFKELLEIVVNRNLQDDDKQNPHISKSIEYLHKHFQESITLQDMGDHLNLNICYFCSLFKNHTGLNFNQYLTELRIDKSKELLVKTKKTVISIALEVGFNNHTYFSATFKKHTGLTPVAYRKQYQSERALSLKEVLDDESEL